MATESSTQTNLCVAIRLPEKEEDIFGERDFFQHIALACGAMAKIDGILTINEFLAFAETADKLASIYNNPLLLRVLMLKGVLDQNIDFETSLNFIKKIKTEVSEEHINNIFLALVPLLKCQGSNCRSLANKWGTSLNLDKVIIEDHLSTFPKDKEVSRLFSFLRKRKSYFDRARDIAILFNDEILLSDINALDKNNLQNKLDELRQYLENSFDKIITYTENKLKKPDEFQSEQFAVIQFNNLTEAMIIQTKYRLEAVRRRLDFESKLFEEDLKSFLEDSVCKVELEMLHLVNEISNWDDINIWERFSQEQAYRDMLIRWKTIADRHDKLCELWSVELADFSNEIQTNIQSVLSNIDPRAFAGIVPTKHSPIIFKNLLDSLADFTLGIATLGTIATTVAVAATSGVAASFSWVLPLFAGPVGIPITVAITSAMLWKFIANPSKRKYKMVQDKVEVIRKNIVNIIGDPLPKHNETLINIMESFNEAASMNYYPLISLARLSLIHKELEFKVIKKVLEDTKTFFTSIIYELKNDKIIMLEK